MGDRCGMWFLAALVLSCLCSQVILADRPPNIVYIMSDELAYYELSHMGNSYIKTPTIDRFAEEGIRFTQALAGSPVCAPLRCTLMTGKHAGHASVRANDGGTPLRADEVTIASLLKAKGYATGGFGKWGCGGRDSTGVPEDHGFDVFYGYYDQVHAHSFFPEYLLRNSDEVPLKGNAGGRSGETYSHYSIMEEGLKFIREHKDEPFFCYFPITPPHGMYDIPEDDPAWDLYRNESWVRDSGVSQDVKNYAAMVSMVDRNLGQVLALLQELELEGNTIVFFTGDNGGQDRFSSQQHPRGFFGPNVNPKTGVEFRGGKGNLYEGGLRIPFLVRWPQKVVAGTVSDLVFYQPDVLPTLAELAGVGVPNDVDGMSIVPELLGASAAGRPQQKHEYLYWEFGGQTAVRMGEWKGIQPGQSRDWELYHLSNDVSEVHDLSAQQTAIVERMKAIAEASHEPVRPGTYLDAARTRHERDRLAKWGKNPPAKTGKRSKIHRINADNLVPAGQLKVVRFSSQNEGNGKLALNAIDDRPDTIWHTQFSGDLKKHPHEMVVDLGQTCSVTDFHYLARQDTGWNGAFADTEFFVSDTADDFGDAVLKTTFTKTRKPQQTTLKSPAIGRFVLIRVLSEVNGGPWASAAEIAVGVRKPR